MYKEPEFSTQHCQRMRGGDVGDGQIQMTPILTWVWWLTPVIQTLRSLGRRTAVDSRLAWVTK